VKERKKKEKEKAATGEEKFERAQYNCAFQDEDEGGRDFAPPELARVRCGATPGGPDRRSTPLMRPRSRCSTGRPAPRSSPTSGTGPSLGATLPRQL